MGTDQRQRALFKTLFVDSELFQRDHRLDHPAKPGQRPPIPVPNTFHCLSSAMVRSTAARTLAWARLLTFSNSHSFPPGGLRTGVDTPHPRKPRSASTARSASSAASPVVANERASCIDPGVGSLTST